MLLELGGDEIKTMSSMEIELLSWFLIPFSEDSNWRNLFIASFSLELLESGSDGSYNAIQYTRNHDGAARSVCQVGLTETIGEKSEMTVFESTPELSHMHLSSPTDDILFCLGLLLNLPFDIRLGLGGRDRA